MTKDGKKAPKTTGEMLRDFGRITLFIGALIIGAEVFGDAL